MWVKSWKIITYSIFNLHKTDLPVSPFPLPSPIESTAFIPSETRQIVSRTTHDCLVLGFNHYGLFREAII
jgi:hypothetical protein